MATKAADHDEAKVLIIFDCTMSAERFALIVRFADTLHEKRAFDGQKSTVLAEISAVLAENSASTADFLPIP